MNAKRFFYGVRYLGGNRSCTTGDPHPLTGRMSKAAEIIVFLTAADRDDWVRKERLSEPSGCGGGERVAATRADCRRVSLGETMEEYELGMRIAEEMACDTETETHPVSAIA